VTHYVAAQQVRDRVPDAVLHYASGLCVGTQYVVTARMMAKAAGHPGFWRLKGQEK